MYFHCPYSICLPRPFFNELLRHGGGANVSVDTNRCAFTAQYCQPWVRQQENMMLSFPWMVGEVSGLVDSGGFVEPLSFLRCHVYTSNRLANLLRMMSVPFQEVQELPEAIQSMIGYSIHPPFIGHVDGRHPLKAAERLAKLWRQLWWLRVTVMSDCFQTFGICCHWFGKLFFFRNTMLTFLICTNLTDSNERFLEFGTAWQSAPFQASLDAWTTFVQPFDLHFVRHWSIKTFLPGLQSL